MNIVLIETSGNQHYIFATNKLRENVGASELTYQVGTRYVLQAVEQEIGKTIWIDGDKDGSQLRANLLNPSLNPPIENADTKIEVVVATSGKAILLVKEKSLAEKIVCEVTKNALIEMPGLTVHGAICEVGKAGQTDDERLKEIHKAVVNVHRRLESLRHKIPSNQQRFLRLPHVEPCATSGLPAEKIYRHESLKTKPVELKPHSSLSIKKQEKSNEGRNRLEKTIQTVKPNVKLMGNINELENKFKETRWLAIIHADGNGLGEIFMNFADHLNIERNTDENGTFKTTEDVRKYIKAYRNFSIALDICTINATGFAIEKFQNSYLTDYQGRTGKITDKLPFIPLILGGDDLTVICDGEYALRFAKDFLEQFEEETKRLDSKGNFKQISDSLKDLIPRISNNAFGNKNENNPLINRLGICAGIAIVKPHCPFHQAYELAEQLLKSAKQVKTKVRHKPLGHDVALPCSAMDFHVLYDSSGVELSEIRDKLKADEGSTYLYAKPYIVTPENDLGMAADKSWLAPRTWEELATRVCAMRAEDDDGKRKLPNSQMHHIRESLHRGQRETDSEVDLFKHRYSSRDPQKDKGFGELLCEKTGKAEDGKDKKEYSLFFKESHGYTTHFLDALDVVEFWKGFECDGETEADGIADGNAGDGDEQ